MAKKGKKTAHLPKGVSSQYSTYNNVNLIKQAEDSILTIFTTNVRFDDQVNSDYKDIAFARLKLLLFFLTKRTLHHSMSLSKPLVDAIGHWGIFATPKIVEYAKKNNFLGVQREVGLILKREAKFFWGEAINDFYFVIFILMHYSEEFRKISRNNTELLDVLEPLLDYAFCTYIEKIYSKYLHSLLNIQKNAQTAIVYTNIGNIVAKPLGYSGNVAQIKDFSLFYLDSMDEKKEIASIMNQYISKLVDNFDTETQVFKDKVTWENLNLDGFQTDWEMLHKCLTFDRDDVLDNGLTTEDISVPMGLKWENEDLDFYHTLFALIWCAMSDKYSAFLADLSMYIVGDFNNIAVATLTGQKKARENEILELKQSNKSLNRSIVKLEKELEKKDKELEAEKNKVVKPVEIISDYKEINRLNKLLSAEISKSSELTDNNTKLSVKVEWQEKKISKLEDMVASYEVLNDNQRILENENAILRHQLELMEKIKQDGVQDFDKKLESIKDLPILFVGGVGGMMAKFKEYFPNSEYYDIASESQNITIAPRFEYIVIYTKMVKHSHCRQIEKQVGKEKIISINICNPELVIEELYDVINGHE